MRLFDPKHVAVIALAWLIIEAATPFVIGEPISMANVRLYITLIVIAGMIDNATNTDE